jgi:hypothetical protein
LDLHILIYALGTGQEQQAAEKKEPDVNAGPFTAFLEKKAASAMQKFIVPWNIALHG